MYVAVTVAIVLGTLVVFALLSWGRSPEETDIEAPEPSNVAASKPVPASHVKPAPAKTGKPRHKVS
jgi:hypothetical protein